MAMRFKFLQIIILFATPCLLLGEAVLAQTSKAEEKEESKPAQAFHWLERDSTVNGQVLGTSQLGKLDLTDEVARGTDVERETVQVDSQTIKTVERMYRRDANGRRKLENLTEVELRTFPDGRAEAVQTQSTVDLNGRMQAWRQQRQETRSLGQDDWETTSNVLKPGPNGKLVTVYRIRQTERKGDDNVVRVERAVEETDLNSRWNVVEQRSATIQEKGGETIQQETVYEKSAFGKLALRSQISSIEWKDEDGGVHRTIDTYQPNSRGKMDVVERIEVSEVTLSDGSKQSVQELQTRSSANGSLQLVQRVAQDLSKSRNGDTVQDIRIERLDVYGKMSPTEQIRRTQTEKETGPGKKSFTSKPN
jgi:hypothetical protein